jgi:hypothetical protein
MKSRQERRLGGAMLFVTMNPLIKKKSTTPKFPKLKTEVPTGKYCWITTHKQAKPLKDSIQDILGFWGESVMVSRLNIRPHGLLFVSANTRKFIDSNYIALWAPYPDVCFSSVESMFYQTMEDFQQNQFKKLGVRV